LPPQPCADSGKQDRITAPYPFAASDPAIKRCDACQKKIAGAGADQTVCLVRTKHQMAGQQAKRQKKTVGSEREAEPPRVIPRQNRKQRHTGENYDRMDRPSQQIRQNA